MILVLDPSLPRHSDKCRFPQLLLENVLENNGEIPHPLVLRLSTATKSVLVGVKEFTSPEGQILVPQEILDRLTYAASEPATTEVATIPPVTSLLVKPAVFYPHIVNWKYYLESFVSANYTTLSEGQIFFYEDKTAGVTVLLQVEAANAPSVVVIDSDAVLDVIPLDDTMAAQHLAHSEDVGNFENATLLGADPLAFTLEPFSKARVPKLLRIDLKHYEKPFQIRLISQDATNVDLLVGTDQFVTLENFLWSTISQDNDAFKRAIVEPKSDIIANYTQHCKDSESGCYLYVVPFAWDHAGEIELSVTEYVPEGPDDEVGKVRCGNCKTLIDKANFQLHEAFCYRTNVRCECGQIFTKSVPHYHWHCSKCDPLQSGNSTLAKFKHDRMFHSGPYVCTCGETTEYALYLDLVTSHKATDCPLKIHECRFCHMIVPQEQATYQDKYANLTHHESECGGKTTECYLCGNILKRRDLASHLKIHELKKVQENEIQLNKCSNANCVNLIDDASPNDLRLCALCFGPLFAPVHDPTYVKLKSRIERKYMLQLTKGCGNAKCENQECATGYTPLDFKLAHQRVQNKLLPFVKVPQLPGVVAETTHNIFWFCVDSSTANRRELVQLLQKENNYSSNSVIRAVNATTSEASARDWLQLKGVKS